MAIATGWSGCVDRLVEVLGLKGQRVKKIVLVFDIDCPITAYVERFLDEEEVDGVTDIVQAAMTLQPGIVVAREVVGIEVDEKGVVSTG